MAEKPHELDRDWRVPRITALDSDARTIDDTLTHLDDLAALFEYKDESDALTEVRTLSGRLRSLRDEYDEEAATLRADVQTK